MEHPFGSKTAAQGRETATTSLPSSHFVASFIAPSLGARAKREGSSVLLAGETQRRQPQCRAHGTHRSRGLCRQPAHPALCGQLHHGPPSCTDRGLPHTPTSPGAGGE